ncbi:phosphate ABC transporter substrate-binding protein PstS [Marisediminicola senii]|uniref:phosphate ABC transporter substrate-binding protein PstS n=1 Tax=Marisediminicola senii TaxID=2711233 RepID=UPI0013ED7E1C|nr:phosphate ABC transporter substrate-binding protein PstS [Marisediminicola senii]
MNSTRLSRAAVIAVAGALFLSSCAANEADTAGGGSESDSTLSGTLVGAGASSQAAGQQAWTAGFQELNPDTTVEYDPSGSGAGRDTFIAGGSSFAGSDAAFDLEEIEAGEFGSCVPDTGIIEIPAYISPIAVIFNLEGVDSLNMDPATIAGIFTGDITTWNDPAIAATNEGVELPDTPITAVHRADESGTTENFAEYLSATAPDVWDAEVSGDWPYGGEAANQTTGVVDTVTNGTGTIGYADASQAGDLGTVAVGVGDEFVEYSAEAAAAIVDASPFSEGRGENDLAIELDRTSTESGVYPIVLISYLIACEEYNEAEAAELTKAYLGYIISDEGQAVAEEAAGIAPISETLFERASAAVESIQ